MRKTAARMISLALVLVIVLAGCNRTGDNTQQPQETQAPSTVSDTQNTETSSEPAALEVKDYTLPIVTDGTSLSITTWDNGYAPASYTTGLPVFNEIEQRTGVHIKWDVTPAAQFFGEAGMAVRMAAGKDLSDIISLPEPGTSKYWDSGLLIPLDDLIAQYAPNIRKFFEMYPNLKRAMTAPDGKIYALQSVIEGTNYTDPAGLIIRQDWLDKLGLPEPATLDDWYNVLKAFKERDPNGNGQADELPFTSGWHVANGSYFPLLTFGNALGLHLYGSQGYYPDANGNIQYEWLDERTRELVVWLNKLYAEGLIDPAFVTNTGTEVEASITRDLAGATTGFLNNTNRFNANLETAGIKANWRMTLPPSNSGDKYYERNNALSAYWSISKDSDKAEVAIKWLDFVYASEEGNLLTAMGIEGVSYTMVNGVPEFTEFVYKNPDGLGFNQALRSLGAMPNIPWIRTGEGPWSRNPVASLTPLPALKEQAERLKNYKVDSIGYLTTPPTLEESATLAKFEGDLTTYRDEMISKFITGQAPIEWDKFTAQLQALHIDEIIAVKQAQYDRAQAQ